MGKWAIPEKNKPGGWGPSGNSKQNKASLLETLQNLLYNPIDKNIFNKKDKVQNFSCI